MASRRIKQSEKKPVSVMISKRANVMYLEMCRVQMFDERVVYLTQGASDVEKFFNIPERNTAFLLLGMGTSITQAAIRRLAEANVIVGFCGTGGSPPYGSIDFAFMNMESEYRPAEYMQRWAHFWFNDEKRLHVAKIFMNKRRELISVYWPKLFGLTLPETKLQDFSSQAELSRSTEHLLLVEARWAKYAYSHVANFYGVSKFARVSEDDSEGTSKRINAMLDQGNYLAYGYAATALSGLGISFMFPVLHGKTRRGALVFDLADIFKDAIVLPTAFEQGSKRKSQQEFRQRLIEICHEEKILDLLFGFVKSATKIF